MKLLLLGRFFVLRSLPSPIPIIMTELTAITRGFRIPKNERSLFSRDSSPSGWSVSFKAFIYLIMDLINGMFMFTLCCVLFWWAGGMETDGAKVLKKLLNNRSKAEEWECWEEQLKLQALPHCNCDLCLILFKTFSHFTKVIFACF